jgi:hypothetical protein
MQFKLPPLQDAKFINMKTLKQYMPEGGGIVKTLAFFLRNKLSRKVKEGLSATNTSEKLDAILVGMGILGGIGIMNIGMEDKGKSLLSRGVIIRGLINELKDDGILTQKEKELFND